MPVGAKEVVVQKDQPPEVAAKNDAIDLLVDSLSGTHGEWINGVFPEIKLPGSASPQDVIRECFRMAGFSQGRVKQYQIQELRTVHIPYSMPTDYLAALVETELGTKIVLLRYESPATGWWTRVFDAAPGQSS